MTEALIHKKHEKSSLVSEAREHLYRSFKESILKLGAELEFRVVDSRGRDAPERAVAEAIEKHRSDGVVHEFGRSTFEANVEPVSIISNLEQAIQISVEPIITTLRKNGLKVLGYGISPLTAAYEENSSGKDRYRLLLQYGKEHGYLQHAMGSNASLQFHTSAKSADEAIRVKKAFDALTPVLYVMFANSPIGPVEGVLGKIERPCKSLGRKVWDFSVGTKGKRHGLIETGSADEYFDKLLELDMLFVVRGRDKRYLAVKDESGNNITFRQFLETGIAYGSPYGQPGSIIKVSPELPNDLYITNGTFWPTSRLNLAQGTNEHRMFDSQPQYLAPVVGAMCYGLVRKINETETLASELASIGDPAEEAEKALKYGYSAGLYGMNAGDLAYCVLQIAELGLDKKDKELLAPIKELVYEKKSPADIILSDRYSLRKLMKESEWSYR